MSAANALSTQRLAEFLAVVSAVADADAAVRVAVERAARVLEAEAAAVFEPDRVVASIGYAFGAAPLADLRAAASGAGLLDVPGAGACRTVVVPLAGEISGHLLVARSGADGFGVDEVSLLRGMGRVLELTVANLRTVQALRDRQRLLEQLSLIQRAITRRAPLQCILDAVTAGARELIGDQVAVLHVVDPDDPGALLLMSSTGLPAELVRRLWRIPVTTAGVAGRAVEGDRLVVRDDGSDEAAGIPEIVAAAIRSSMAAPVHENGVVVGSLVVASYRPGRSYGAADREVLTVFAEHVSLALTDARTQQAMAQAFHDSLTGLASRALFLDRVDHALARAGQQGTTLAVLFVDLDRFKTVNDSLGHSAGDALLVGVAERLRECLGPEATAARLGGDEFAVLCERVEPAAAIASAERILKRLRAPFAIHGQDTYIDASVGIAFHTDGPTTPAELIRDADLAMYQAKKNGKGRYEVFRPQLRTAFLRNLDIEARLRQAVDRGDLVVHYQPVMRLSDGALVGVEALVRWCDGQADIVPPAEFIPLAEESGLILSIDRWVLREACRQGGRWNRRPGAAPVNIGVNVSARQVLQPDLPALVARALGEAGLHPARLVLEITESRLMHDVEAAADRLRQLKATGVRVAIDDFGTGYSSLAYLRQFPADILKIDRSFVTGAAPRSAGATLARAIVRLGRTLRLTTVAEGVETAEQLDELRAAGCDLAQGFYLGSPMPADQIEPMLPDAARLPT